MTAEIPNPAQSSLDPSLNDPLLIVEAIIAQPEYMSSLVTPIGTSFKPETTMVEGAVNEAIGVEQDLFGVIQAGGDTFGIVGAKTIDGESHGFLLTHFSNEAKRATIVGAFGEGQPLLIGRKHQKGLHGQTSGDHFSIELRDGTFVLHEPPKATTNGTELIRPAPSSMPAYLQTEAGFTALKKSALQKHPYGQKNPLDNLNTWSASSASVRALLQEQTKKPDDFKSTYEVPGDQFGFEMELRDRLITQFPETTDVINEALADLQRAAGIDIPKYKVTKESALDAIMDNQVDEMGYFNMKFGPTTSAKMYLKTPITRTTEEYTAMPETERLETVKGDDGMLIIGKLPAETKALVEGLYQLTGASVVRDERLEGEDPAAVIREGVYQGEKIYFKEIRHARSYYGDKPTFSLWSIGSEAAQRAIDSPNEAQRKEFVEVSGIDPFDWSKTFSQYRVTRYNYAQIARDLASTRELLDNLEDK